MRLLLSSGYLKEGKYLNKIGGRRGDGECGLDKKQDLLKAAINTF